MRLVSAKLPSPPVRLVSANPPPPPVRLVKRGAQSRSNNGVGTVLIWDFGVGYTRGGGVPSQGSQIAANVPPIRAIDTSKSHPQKIFELDMAKAMATATVNHAESLPNPPTDEVETHSDSIPSMDEGSLGPNEPPPELMGSFGFMTDHRFWQDYQTIRCHVSIPNQEPWWGAPCAVHAVQKVGCFPPPVATGPRVLDSASHAVLN